MKQLLCHLFLPHITNNQRAKLLHHSTIFFLILFFFVSQFLVSYIKTDHPAVLGSSVDISTEKLLKLTNKDRAEKKLPLLVLSPVLSRAASMKADYMFEKNFWAHTAPDGTTPWHFIKKSGYVYVYAGENLARGFIGSSDVIDAWMESPTHRENMLSSNYKEIGFAVKKGKLLGEDTILVVEMFGSRDAVPIASVPQQSIATSQTANVLPAATTPESIPIQLQNGYVYTLKTTSLLSSRMITSSIGLFVLGVLIFVLFLDIIIIERKKIVRIVGHNVDHILFFSAVIIVMIISLRGIVL